MVTTTVVYTTVNVYSERYVIVPMTAPEEECLLLNSKGTLEIRDCSTGLPGICVYKPKLMPGKRAISFTQLCPHPYQGYVIQNSQLICFALINEPNMSWSRAEQVCSNQSRVQVQVQANLSMATFENARKFEIFQLLDKPEHERAWIGLKWVEKFKKFCWVGTDDCQMDHFNWDPFTDWVEGFYGVASYSQWSLLPESQQTTLDHVWCQAIIHLDTSHQVSFQHEDTGDISVTIQVRSVREDSVKSSNQSLGNMSEFFRQQQIWPTEEPLNGAAYDALQLDCFTANGSLHRLESVGTTVLHTDAFGLPIVCQGWLGWPRQFKRFIYSIPPRNSSFIYHVILKTRWASLTKAFTSNNSYLSRKHYQNEMMAIKTDFFHSSSFRITGLRLHISGENIQITARIQTLPNSSVDVDEQMWPQLFSNYMRSTVACQEEQYDTSWKGRGVSTLRWHSTPIGWTAVSDPECLTHDGLPLQRKCRGNVEVGAYWQSVEVSINTNVTD